MPRPGTPVIHPRWEDWHRPTAEGQMTAECAITRPGHTPAFSESTGRSAWPVPASVYSGPCRIQASQRLGNAGEVGGAQVIQHRYQISVPADASPPHVNDQVTVTTCSGDPTLVGRILRVVDVLDGSLTWQRDFTAEDTTPTTR